MTYADFNVQMWVDGRMNPLKDFEVFRAWEAFHCFPLVKFKLLPTVKVGHVTPKGLN